MLIIADFRVPPEAKEQLLSFGKVLWLTQQQTAYETISSHPDIFFCPVGDQLIVASNLSETMIDKLEKRGIQYSAGQQAVGVRYPDTAGYNVVVTDKFLIGNINFTDKRILEVAGNRKIIHVTQGYTRCNLIPLKNDRFITSDKGIRKALLQYGQKVLFVSPAGIVLPGFPHGFIGGACGVWQDRLFFLGGLKNFPEGQKIRDFVSDMEIIELYDGPLFDAGGLLFIS